MEKLNNDFFAELKDLNAQYGGQWSEEEEKSLYKQLWDMAEVSDKTAYEIFEEFRLLVIRTTKRDHQHIFSLMDKLDMKLDLRMRPYIIGPKAGINTKSSHNEARALAAKAKQKKRLAKRRKK